MLQSHQKMLLPVVFLTRNTSTSVWNHKCLESPEKAPALLRAGLSNSAGTEHWISDQAVKMADVEVLGGGAADT